MSWFGEEDDRVVYSAGISVTHLIPKLPENPRNAAVLSAVRNNGSIVNNIVAVRNASMFSSMEKYLAITKATPSLDTTTSTFPSELGDVLPVIIIRENNFNILTNGSSPTFVGATKKALSTMGADLVKITAAVDASPSATNDVFFMLACRIWSPTVGAKAYFYHFLESMYDPTWDSIWFYFYQNGVWSGDYYTQFLKQFSIIQNDGELVFYVKYLTINKQTITGVIGPVGSYRKVHVAQPLLSVGVDTENFDTTSCAKQISATQYVEYTMYGLVIENRIKHGQDYTRVFHSVSMNSPVGTGDINGYYNKVNGAYGSFLLPMFKGVLDKVNPFDLEQMLAESVILYVHGVSQTTVPWWKSPGFYAILGEIVNIVAVIFSGSALSLSPDLVTLIRQVAIGLLTGIVSEYLFEALAPIIGEAAAAAIVGVTALAVLRYAPEGIKSLGELPWAEDLLKAARVIIDSVDIASTKDALELTKDIDAFNKSADAFNEELERANKLLGTTDSNLKRSNINDIINAYETPEEFYTRTIHQGNIGVLGLDAIANYAANKLRLPKELPA